MSPKQVEKQVIELIHREPFAPFVVEINDSQLLENPHARLSNNGAGAGFFGPDGGIVDFEFKTVRAIRAHNAEAAA